MSRIKIGWAGRDVSTNKPVNIPGQMEMRISRGVLDPLMANVLVLDGGEDVVIFLSADFVHIRNHLLLDVRRKVKAYNPQIPAEKIIVNATHTHTGASYYPEKGDTYPPHEGLEIASSEEYGVFLSDTLADAVAEAWENRKPGGIAYGYGYATVGHSRRETFFDDLALRPGANNTLDYVANGHARMYGNPNDPMFAGYEAGAESFVDLLYTFDENDQLTGAIVNVPCPSQNSEMEYYLSADYWHNVRQLIQERFGNIHILSQCAAAGDLSPRIMHYRDAQNRRFALKYGDLQLDPRVKQTEDYYARLDIAERIQDCFTEVLSWARKDIRREMCVRHSVRIVELPKNQGSEEDYLFYKRKLAHYNQQDYMNTGDVLKDFYHNTILDAYRTQCVNAITRYEADLTDRVYPVELHTVMVGDIAFATNPFELYMDYQHRIQARSPFQQTFIIQLSNEISYAAGYLATERAVAGRGYSAVPASCVVSPAGGQLMVEETLADLHKLKNQ